MKRTENNIYIYDSIGEFADWLDKTKPTKRGAEYNGSHSVCECKTKESGTKDFEEASNLLKNGDTILARMIVDQEVKIRAKSAVGYVPANRITNDCLGFVPNIGACMTGHPHNMINLRQTFKPMCKVLNIVYSSAVGWTIPTNAITSAAAKVACAISTLEKKGYRVNLWVGYKAHFHSKSTQAVIKIKDAGKTLDPLRIAYPLAHPSMLRRHFFAHMERVTKIRLNSYYGTRGSLYQSEINPLIGKSVILNAADIINDKQTFEDIVGDIEKQSKKC